MVEELDSVEGSSIRWRDARDGEGARRDGEAVGAGRSPRAKTTMAATICVLLGHRLLHASMAGSFSKIGRGSSRMANTDSCGGMDKPEHDL